MEFENKKIRTSVDKFASEQSIRSLVDQDILRPGVFIKGIEYYDCNKIIEYIKKTKNIVYEYTAYGGPCTMLLV